jgi:hypothetical protein
MQQHAAAKGAIAERSTPKLSFSIFVRICSTKRAPTRVLNENWLISKLRPTLENEIKQAA